MLSDEQIAQIDARLCHPDCGDADYAVSCEHLASLVAEIQQRRAWNCETCKSLYIARDGEAWCNLMSVNLPDAVTGCDGWQTKEPR